MDKIFIITGEPSGDLHGANLVHALLKINPQLNIQCWGGDKMKAAGAQVLKHVDELAFMGFIEVLANLGTILKNFKLCKNQIEAFRPDLVVFIDYPGFNLRMAQKVKQLGIETAYYISPQIWAWKENRVKTIKQYIDHVFVILPFEKAFFKKHGVDANYVGHPLLDELQKTALETQEIRTLLNIEKNKPIIAILPGSRTQEIKKLLGPMSAVAKRFPDKTFVVSKVHWQPESLYKNLPENVFVLEGHTYKLLSAAEAALVTSGTATLETALLGTPQVVVYKANALSIAIARKLIKVKYISLVNLIMDEDVVTELIQKDVNVVRICKELEPLFEGGVKRNTVKQKYAELREKLGGGGASEITANALLKIIASQGK